MQSDSENGSYILHIGMTSGKSVFDGKFWELFTEWCGRMIDRIWVYYRVDDDSVKKAIEDMGLESWDELEPDKLVPRRKSRLTLSSEQVYRALHTFSFHIDYGVESMFACKGERLLVYIYTQDDQNYAELYLTRSEAKELCCHLGDLSENLRICAEDAFSIDSYAEPGWKPLGCAE